MINRKDIEARIKSIGDLITRKTNELNTLTAAIEDAMARKDALKQEIATLRGRWLALNELLSEAVEVSDNEDEAQD